MGIRDGEAIREFFNLPENEQAVSVIAVGYGTKDAQMPKRKSVSDITKFYQNRTILDELISVCFRYS